MSRLPVVSADGDAWGTILNDFLSVRTKSDGFPKDIYASYVIIDLGGGNCSAFSPIGLPDVASNANAAAVFQSCLTNMGGAARGTIVFGPGTYSWTTVPLWNRTYASGGSDDKLWTRIIGVGAKIVMSGTNGGRFLDFNKQADYDGFCGLEFAGFTIDAGNLTGVGMGYILPGVDAIRIDIRRIHYHDIQGYNARSLSTGGGRQWVWLKTSHAAVNEATPNVIEDITLERLHLRGGDTGILAAGGLSVGSDWRTLKISQDRFYLADIDFDSGVTPSVFYSGTGIQVGGGAYGGRLVMERCRVKGLGDDGIETNGFMKMVIRDCVAENCTTEGFYCPNFNYLNGIDNTPARSQTVVYDNCEFITSVSTISGQAATKSIGWELPNLATMADSGTIIIRDCSFRNTVAPTNIPSGASEIYAGIYFPPTGPVWNRVIIENYVQDMFFSNSQSNGRTFTICGIFSYRCPKELIIKDVMLNFRGAMSGTDITWLNGVDISTSPGTVRFSIDGVRITDDTTGRTAGTSKSVVIGAYNASGVGTYVGTIRRVKHEVPASDTQPFGVYIYGTANLTITPKILVEDCDFSSWAAIGGATEITVTDATNGAKVFRRNNKLKTNPQVGVAFTPGATTVAAQYTGGYEGLMSIAGGTVTVVSVSPDNVTYYQVAAGTNTSFYIDNGWYVRMTYTVVPTCVVLPRR